MLSQQLHRTLMRHWDLSKKAKHENNYSEEAGSAHCYTQEKASAHSVGLHGMLGVCISKALSFLFPGVSMGICTVGVWEYTCMYKEHSCLSHS